MASRHWPLLGLLSLAACRSEPPFPPPDWRTVAWQSGHCPKAEARDEIRLANGDLAAVTIFQLGDRRLYVPAYWLRRGNDPSESEPSPNGVNAFLQGRNSIAPKIHDFTPGTLDNAYCLGTVHRAVAEPGSGKTISCSA